MIQGHFGCPKCGLIRGTCSANDCPYIGIFVQGGVRFEKKSDSFEVLEAEKILREKEMKNEK